MKRRMFIRMVFLGSWFIGKAADAGQSARVKQLNVYGEELEQLWEGFLKEKKCKYIINDMNNRYWKLKELADANELENVEVRQQWWLELWMMHQAGTALRSDVGSKKLQQCFSDFLQKTDGLISQGIDGPRIWLRLHENLSIRAIVHEVINHPGRVRSAAEIDKARKEIDEVKALLKENLEKTKW